MAQDIETIKNKFFAELIDKPMSFVVSKWVIERTPYIFEGQEDECIIWKENLSKRIGVDSREMTIIGSACMGFSINPTKDFRNFNEKSDIDVAVISSYYFELSWHYLRNMGTKRYSLTSTQRNSIEDHVTRLIYWGTIATDKILSVLPFGKEWIEALAVMSDECPTEGRDIKLRIYKDFQSLRDYNVNNFNRLRNILLERSFGGARHENLLKHDA